MDKENIRGPNISLKIGESPVLNQCLDETLTVQLLPQGKLKNIWGWTLRIFVCLNFNCIGNTISIFREWGWHDPEPRKATAQFSLAVIHTQKNDERSSLTPEVVEVMQNLGP